MKCIIIIYYQLHEVHTVTPTPPPPPTSAHLTHQSPNNPGDDEDDFASSRHGLLAAVDMYPGMHILSHHQNRIEWKSTYPMSGDETDFLSRNGGAGIRGYLADDEDGLSGSLQHQEYEVRCNISNIE